MTDNDTHDGEEETDERIQDVIDNAMPTLPEERQGRVDNPDRMTTDEHSAIHDGLESIVQTLYDRGYSPSELGVIFSGFEHRMNASRYRPHEFDRIGLTLRVREAIEAWKEEQPEEVPELVVAEAIEELGRHHRHMARKELYKDDDSEEEDNE